MQNEPAPGAKRRRVAGLLAGLIVLLESVLLVLGEAGPVVHTVAKFVS